MCKWTGVKYNCEYDCKFGNNFVVHEEVEEMGCIPCDAAKKRASDSGETIETGTTVRSRFCCQKGSEGYEYNDNAVSKYKRCAKCKAAGKN